jgi:hypothetical protein
MTLSTRPRRVTRNDRQKPPYRTERRTARFGSSPWLIDRNDAGATTGDKTGANETLGLAVKAESRWSPEVGSFRTRRVSKSGEEPTERLLIGDSKGGISAFISSWSIRKFSKRCRDTT